MEKDVLKKLKLKSRDEVLSFLKSLWNETPSPCPVCGGMPQLLHKKAKKSSCDWICGSCGMRFDTIKLLNELNEG